MLRVDRIERLQERMRALNIDAYLVLGHVSDWGSASRALSWRLAR